MKKVNILLFDTDVISFADEDFISGEADITESLEDDSMQPQLKNEDSETAPYSDCAFLCPLCCDCMHQGEM